MQNRSNAPIRKPPGKAGGADRFFVLSWGLGLMSGMVASAIAVMGALALGYLSLGVQVASAQEPLSTPGATGVDPLVAQTQLAEALMEGTPTVAGSLLPSATPTPPAPILSTATPNYIATATQACSLFRSGFPGTPCPPFNTPMPMP
jgi:hypothetical protein